MSNETYNDMMPESERTKRQFREDRYDAVVLALKAPLPGGPEQIVPLAGQILKFLKGEIDG